jgi:hypothetical protein
VVGGIVAALIVLTGGDDGGDKGVTVDGTVTDPTTGITVPRLEGWVVPDSADPADQAFERPCGPSKSRSPSADPDESAGPRKCYRAGLRVEHERADSFEALIAEFKRDMVDDKGRVIITDTEADDAVRVDGKPAHVLRVKVEGRPEDLRVDSDTAWAQVVAIDAPDDDGRYPCVEIRLENSPAAPDKSVFETVLKGIKVGEPTPTESSS